LGRGSHEEHEDTKGRRRGITQRAQRAQRKIEVNIWEKPKTKFQSREV
jgi:hypothetical protein